MMKRLALFAMYLLLVVAGARGEDGRAARGMVVSVDAAHRSLVISCDAISGYMDAMEMRFAVRSAALLSALRPGVNVQFTMVKRGKVLVAEDVKVVSGENFESEPMEAAGMKALQGALDGAENIVAPGDLVPEFALTDQAGELVRMSDLRGKVVVLTFGYSRCPNPEYCFRLSSNLEGVERRFASRAGKDLVLVTVAIDPEHDNGEVLREYAAVFHAEPPKWDFLTGPLPEVKRVAAMFGMDFWRRGGLLMHSLHTVVIDREGRVMVNLEGNGFSVRQLGDVVAGVLGK
jgi:protein SCO1/2